MALTNSPELLKHFWKLDSSNLDERAKEYVRKFFPEIWENSSFWNLVKATFKEARNDIEILHLDMIMSKWQQTYINWCNVLESKMKADILGILNWNMNWSTNVESYWQAA